MYYVFVELNTGARIYTNDMYYMEGIVKTVLAYKRKGNDWLANKTVPSYADIHHQQIQVNTDVCQVVGMDIASTAILAIPTRMVTKCYLVNRDVDPAKALG